MEHADWTLSWRAAAGLALSTWTRERDALTSPGSRRLLELALELTVLREDLVLHAYVIVPGAFHLVTGGRDGRDGSERLPWSLALGRVKSCHARWLRGAGIMKGALWREEVRIQPLAQAQVDAAVARLHEAPVRLGLAESAGEWDATSWHALYRLPRPGFVRPAGVGLLSRTGAGSSPLQS